FRRKGRPLDERRKPKAVDFGPRRLSRAFTLPGEPGRRGSVHMSDTRWQLYKLRSPKTEQGKRVRYWVEGGIWNGSNNVTHWEPQIQNDNDIHLKSPGPHNDPPHMAAEAGYWPAESFLELYTPAESEFLRGAKEV